jgi:NTE family protein
VLRWFEEHRIPIDVVAGTSMGGLVGGAFASGMSSAELADLLDRTDWDQMFGASAYRYKSIQRKEDARAYPGRLELQLRHGVALPAALNNGQQVDLLLAGIAARYAGLASFDSLPTPFRCIAFDLPTATAVVLESGSLPTAMRATMSLPGVFPPVVIGSRVLVDGGAVNNVPADVVRKMGADVVIAVDVGNANDTTSVSHSFFDVMNNTVDAMTRANTRRGMANADVLIAPDLDHFSSLDWRRAKELAVAGYAAAESHRDELLPLAVDEQTWNAYLAARARKRLSDPPKIASLEIVGATPQDERRIRRFLDGQIGRPLDVRKVAADLTRLSGLDRYQSVSWDLEERDGRYVLVVLAQRYTNAPPILMTTVNVRNQTSDDFDFQLAARFLAYDRPFPRSELRVDGALGTDPSLGAELRQPIGSTRLFAAVLGGAEWNRINFTRDNTIVAQYSESRVRAELDLGAQPVRDLEFRVGVGAGHYDAHPRVGDPDLPTLNGPETYGRFYGVYDSQDSPIVPSGGLRMVATSRYIMNAPDARGPVSLVRSNDGLVQAELEGSSFWSWRAKARRVFLVAAGGSSFGTSPLPNAQFMLGAPFKLDAFGVGEKRGDNYAVATLGYLHVVSRLPDFLGGPLTVGAWSENGSAFDRFSDAKFESQVGIGAVSETFVGPAFVGYSFGGRARRLFVSFGRVFR